MSRTMPVAALVASVILVGCEEAPTGPQGEAGATPLFAHSGLGGAATDQSQGVVDATAGFTIAVGGASSQRVAQLFTAGVSGQLVELEVPVACADGTLLVEVRNVEAGLPGGEVLAEELFDPSELTWFVPGVATWSVLRLRPSPKLAAGTPYAMVFGNPTGSCGLLPGPPGDPYAGGDGYAFDDVNAAWVPIELGTGRYDLPFYTYMR